MRRAPPIRARRRRNPDDSEFASVSDWVLSTWDGIIFAHRIGWPYDARHIAALLRRGDPIPPDAQVILAETYFEPQPKGRGAPKKSAVVQKKERREAAEAFVDEVDDLQRRGMTLLDALKKYYSARGKTIDDASLKKRYWVERSLLRKYWTNARANTEYAMRLCGPDDSPTKRKFEGYLTIIDEAIAKYAPQR
jgi:hypothetical protein